MEITRMLVPEDKYSIKCPHEMTPEFIIVHNTANKVSAMSEASYMIGNNNKVSYHAVVDNYRVIETIPFNRNSWNAGDGTNGKGNRKGIAIEICYSTGDAEEFSESEKLAAEYIAYLLKQYGWGIEKVTKHQDYSKKYCPHKTLDLGWDRFINIVKSYLYEETEINNNVNNDGSDVEMKTYQNGSTSETIYADTDCKIKVGSLNPREKCDCFGIFNNRAMVRYRVGKTNNYKIGYAKWIGGVK